MTMGNDDDGDSPWAKSEATFEKSDQNFYCINVNVYRLIGFV